MILEFMVPKKERSLGWRRPTLEKDLGESGSMVGTTPPLPPSFLVRSSPRKVVEIRASISEDDYTYFSSKDRAFYHK